MVERVRAQEVTMERTRKPIALAIIGACLAFPISSAAADRAAAPPTTAAPAGAAQGSVAAVDSTHVVRGSKLLGMKVHDRQGASLGDIKDVIVDTNTGRVHYAVLSFGGVLGVGDKLFAIPLSRLRSDAKGRLTLDVDKEQLKSAPGFDAARWPNWNDPGYRAQVDRQYGAAPGEANARFRRVSDIMKTKVKDSHGGDIGKVHDVVVDLGASRVQYVVVDFDRAWNPKDKLVALPMNAFSDGATTSWKQPPAEGAGAPRNAPPALAMMNPGEPTKGTASAVNPPGSVETRPPPVDPKSVQPLPPEPLKTTTSYADDESLVYKGSREDLLNTPAFDRAQYPK
jgi:sporulation protein YlmC with PRC-barrel domain